MNRRQFLSTSAASIVAGAASQAIAIPPLVRVNPRIKGLSMTAYSLKPKMKWFWGKDTGGTLDNLGFLDYCAKLGLDGAELTSYFFPPVVERAELNNIKRRAAVLGLDITSGAMGNNFAYPPGSDETKKELEYTRAWIDHFADLGAPVVRVFAGKKLPPGATPEQIISNVTANLETALAHAEKRGVLLGLENHDFANNIDYLLKILDGINSPWLGVVWDSANLAPTSDPYAQLARIAPYALVAQLKVMVRVDGQNTPADFPRLIKILRDAHYSGYLVLEYEEPEDPYEAIPGLVEELRKLV